MVEIRLLGGVQVTDNDRVISDFVSNKARALVAYLFVTEREWPRPVLADLLWGDMPDARASANLRVTLSNLRRLLGTHLEINRESVGIKKHCAFQLDVKRLQSRLAGLQDNRLEGVVELVEEAVDLYQGEFLEGLHIAGGAPAFEEWALLQRENLHQLVLGALYRLSTYHAASGNYQRAIEFTSHLLALQPWQERAHRQMMLLQALAGNRTAALAQYETCRRILAKELNAKPLPETNALLARIRDDAYDMQPAGSPSGAVLFGREQEQAWLQDEWALARKKPGRLTLVEGQMGMGKTALVGQLLRFVATSSDVTILRTRCLDFRESVPYQPIADLLRQAHEKRPDTIRRLDQVWRMELSWLLPELAESVSGSPAVWPARDSETARQRLYESVARFLTELSNPPTKTVAGRGQGETKPPSKPQQPSWLVLFLDDLQWADAASFDLLRYLIFRLRSVPWWLIGAYQPEGLPSDQPLLTLRHSLAQEGRAGVLSLAPLSNRAVRAWTEALPGLQEEQARQVVDYVMDQSQGNPLIAAALIAELQSTALRQRPDGTWQLEPGWVPQLNMIPFALRELVLLKMGRLSEPTRRVLCQAAAIGVDFHHDQLKRTAGNPEQLRSSLDEGLEQGLISLGEAGGYRFTTGMIRNVVYEQLSQWDRLETKARMPEPAGKNTGKLLQLPQRSIAGSAG